jgi:DNA-binding CsgD family transcriptional regulator
MIECSKNTIKVKEAMDKSHHVNDLAVKFLKFLGKRKPTQQHIEITKKLLLTAVIQEHLYFDEKLTKREKECLLLAAKGYSTEETANILEITLSTVESHRLSIFKKLQCNNIGQAVLEGIRFGHIPRSFI